MINQTFKEFLATYLQEIADSSVGSGVEPVDTVLVKIMQAYPAEFSQLWKSRMDHYGPENFAPQFHKAFRQNDVLPSPHLDMAVHKLLYHTRVFWKLERRIEPTEEGEP